ncbi:MAG: chromate transporter [Clostridia bacterium]|nr:chromate transporter [Clostridia bacterium]
MIFLILFWEFFKIGLFSFGGGYGMISLVRETTLAHGWLTEDGFLDFIGVCESTPGPIAVNMATFVGAAQGGALGAICATLGAILPAFLIMLLLARVLRQARENSLIAGAFSGIRPVVVGLIGATGLWFAVRAVLPDVASVLNTGAPGAVDFKAAGLLVFLLALPPLFQKRFNRRLSAIALIGISAGLGVLLYVW